MAKRFLITGLFFGVLSVICGAFGAHLLKKYLTVEQLISFETAVKYMMYHGLFLIGLSNINHLNKSRFIYYATVIGVVIFSGSIFLLTTPALTQINFKFLGPITPFGGLLLILSWVYALYLVLKN